MSEMSQLSTAMLAVVFAAVMLITGQLFIRSRPDTTFTVPQSQAFLDQPPAPRRVTQ